MQEYGSKYCHESPTIDEYIIHDAIMNAVNLLIDDKDEFIATLTSNIIMVMGKYSKVIDVKAMDERLEQLKEAMFTLVEKNAKSGKDDMNFDHEYEKIAEERKQILKAKNEYTEQKAHYDTYSRRVNEMQKFLGDKNCTMTEFDNELVRRLIQKIKIVSEDKMIITFKSGIEMEQTMEVREKYKGCGQWKRNKSKTKIGACL